MSLLEIRDLKSHYFTSQGRVRAVDGVSLNIGRGESIGLVGESGCGKTTVGFSIIRLLPYSGKIVDGHMYFYGEDLLSLSEEEMQKKRWKNISMVFQAAMNALNPVIRIGDQIADAIILHEGGTKEEAMERVKKSFEQLGIGAERVTNYPFEFSGGMRQRAVISMALACNPELVITDEPTTALDVTIQSQILDLLAGLRETFHMSQLLITHDLSVVAETCDNAAIMYAGKIVEQAKVEEIFKNPIHPYTKGLIEAVPSIKKGKTQTLSSIPGEPPDLLNPPIGCRFHPRCTYTKEICKKEEPEMVETMGRRVACHFEDKMKDTPIKRTEVKN